MRALTAVALVLCVMQAGAQQRQLLFSWSAFEGTFTWDEQIKRSGARSVRLHNPSADQRSGVVHVVEMNQTQATPFRVSAWSRAHQVSGSADAGYSLYIDLQYTDGTPQWGLIAPFSTGTHDWEQREVLVIPRKPVAKAFIYLLLRNHAGTVWFDEVQLEILDGQKTLDLQLTRQPTLRAGRPILYWGTSGGLQIHFDSAGIVAQVRYAGTALPPGRLPGGWFLRDLRTPHQLIPFTGKWLSRKPLRWAGKALDIKLEVRYEQVGAMLQAVATLQAPAGSADRAVSLLWVLPVGMHNATWHEDIRQMSSVGQQERAHLIRLNAGANGMMSLYPLACLTGRHWGLAWGWRMDEPRLVRLFANPHWGWAGAAYDVALSGKTRKFPHRATIHLLLWSAEPKWGFRSALQRYIETFPEWFRNRLPKQGIWIPFTAPHTIQGVADFHIAFHEGDNSVAEDDQQGILSFRYTEPMSYWMPMPKEFARTDAGADDCLQRYADGALGDWWQQVQARATYRCAIHDASGKFYRLFSVTPWNDGAMFILNPDPDIAGDSQNPSKAYLNFPPDHARNAYTQPGTQGLDGEYLDSLEMGGELLNFREEHFATADVPLVFDTATRRPAILQIFSTWEYTRYLSQQMRQRGKWLFANGVGWRFPFLMAYIDISGTETNWWHNGVWQPVSPAQMDLWRSLSYHKPYVLLMNTDYETFGSQVERYFQRCLFWGILPSMFSHNAAENPYWQNPTWYNRDRALFQKYIPLIRRVAEAGWQPITHARAEGAWVERYGCNIFTLFNPSSEVKRVRLVISLRDLNANQVPPGQPIELAHSLPLSYRVAGDMLYLNLQLAPEQTAVITW